MSEPFPFFYNENCRSCGEYVDDPFWDELCYHCNHRRHDFYVEDCDDCEKKWPAEEPS